ncbi:MAG: Unknown protein [uncultured Sulfurovum sp.]|uniref:AbiTii domain-containing protein n=1 Tax=uncultured Sulfurovum sp. TaxID=269237 RepID=A0A6S6TQ71_9BACT|nr:MAG: Unknown protein [uncultured Sulfurovum sp.]
MSIVLSLQKNIISGDVNIKDLLREALVIASKLKLNDFKAWINNELKGYPNRQEVSIYRIISGEVKLWNPYQGWQSIPADIAGVLNETLASTLYLTQSIAEVEDLILKKDSESLAFSFPEELAKTLRKALNLNVKFAIFTHRSSLRSIVEQVKTTLLEWSIKLEEEGIIGDENMSFSNEEKNKAQKNIHIENFNGVMGDIENIGNVSTGDYNQNIATINNTLNTKIDSIIEQIEKLPLSDKKEIIHEINENREDKEALTKTLGNLITKGSEVATILPAIGELLGLLA